MKVIIPIGIIVGLIAAIVTLSNFNKQFNKDKDPLKVEEEPEKVVEEIEENSDEIQFEYKESDPVISTQTELHVQEQQYTKDKFTGQGFVIDAQEGTALIHQADKKKKYLVTDAGRTKHKTIYINGFKTNPTIIYSPEPESTTPDPYTGLTGIYANKTISYGYITKVSSHKAYIKRNDGGTTVLTFSRVKKQEEMEQGKKAIPAEAIIEPPTIPSAGGGLNVRPPARD